MSFLNAQTFYKSCVLTLLLGAWYLPANAENVQSTVVEKKIPLPKEVENPSTKEAAITEKKKEIDIDNLETQDIQSSDRDYDPLQSFNRGMFCFNETFDRFILKPTATVYSKILPEFARTGISNFFGNLEQIPTTANDVLQFNFYQAAQDAWRFAINSTVGLLGFFDVASHIGLPPNREDFGLTMARWGYRNSTFIVLPFLGPRTVRDAIGFPINYYLSAYPYIPDRALRYGLYALNVVDDRSKLLSLQDTLNQVAFDKYIFVRNAYLQRRDYLIHRNEELGNPYLEQEDDEENTVKKQ